MGHLVLEELLGSTWLYNTAQVRLGGSLEYSYLGREGGCLLGRCKFLGSIQIELCRFGLDFK